MPWLLMQKFHGRLHAQVYFFNPLNQKWDASWLFDRIIEITESEANLPWEELEIIARARHSGLISIDQPKEQVDEALSKRLAEIIKTSHFEGERNNAKSLFERMNGFAYSGPEYRNPV